MHTRRTNILTGLAVALALIAIACGGGGAKGATGTPNGVNPGFEVPEIQVQHQSAFALADAATWSSALGDQVTAIEDDLMAPNTACGGSVSGASTITASGTKIAVFLTACDTEADAKSLASVIGSPAPQVVVQKCTQLLQVNPSLGPDAQKALDDVKANGGDPTAAFEQSNEKLKTQAGNLSGALSAKLSCDPGQSVFEIPAGGADPCDIPSLSAALGEAVTVNHQLTARVLGPSCRVQPKTKTGFTIGLSCDAQLKKAVPPTEANAAFATADHNAGSQAKAVTDGGLEAFETPATFQAKLRINNTICVLFMETGGSSIDAAAHAVLVAVAQGLKPRFVDKNTFISEGGSSAVAN